MESNYTFNEETHQHFINGREATGVSSIVRILGKPALIQWAANQAVKYIKNTAPKDDVERNADHYLVSEDLLEQARVAHNATRTKAAKHGTDTHALVELYIRECLEKDNGEPYGHEDISPIKKFTDWAQENVERFLFSERNLWDANLFYAGIADFAFVAKNGKRYLADFKTSSGIYGIDYYLQCAGYRILAESMGDEAYDGGCIVRLGKDGSFEVSWREDALWEQDRACFLSALKLYRAQRAFEIAHGS